MHVCVEVGSATGMVFPKLSGTLATSVVLFHSPQRAPPGPRWLLELQRSCLIPAREGEMRPHLLHLEDFLEVE